jgi:type VI protein secretion system component Hcp
MMRFGLAGRAALLVAMALLSGARAIAATPATMTIGEPAPQGKVKGNKVNKGESPAIVIELLSVTRPGSDVASGSAEGKRSSSGADTLVVTKYYDGSSAVLEQAASTNEILHEVTIAFETAATSGNGTATNQKVKGNSARNSASGGASSAPPKAAQVLLLKNVQVDEVDQTRNIQKITLEYQSIEVTYASGKTTAADDWETP